MTEERPDSYNLLCSACLSPCTGADAHVIPSWNAPLGRVITTYRCANCWHASLATFRAILTAGGPEVRASFCDFLERHRFRQDAARLRLAPPEEQLAVFSQLLTAVEDGRLVFDP